MDGWMDGCQSGLRITYSNQQIKKAALEQRFSISFLMEPVLIFSKRLDTPLVS
jgi:hypothetical protein